MNLELLRSLVSTSFTLTFIAFAGCAFYLHLEKDRVPEQFRTVMRVSTVYLAIAAVNYFYMRQMYAAGAAQGTSRFPTEFRYVDWILTTPLMLMKFPLMLGMGRRGRSFMIRLVGLDLVMILTGYIGELSQKPAIHHGFFLLGCIAWFGILASLFTALSSLPERVGSSVRIGVRTMSLFVIIGWAIYPVGFFAPMLDLPNDVRELVYNVADLVNKCGLCLVVYATAKNTLKEETEERELAEEESYAAGSIPAPAE